MLSYSYEQWHVRAAWKSRRPGPGVASRPVDERILLAGGISLYRDQALLDEDAALLRARHYRIIVVDAARFMTTGAFHSKIRLMLDDRGRYIENLDGFVEALRHLHARSRRIAIVFHGFDVFARQCGTLARGVLRAIQEQSRANLIDQKRLIALLQSRAPTLAITPVGAKPVPWNDREPGSSDSPVSGVRVKPSAAAIEAAKSQRSR